MIKIENCSLFGFETFISDNLVLVNITVDPEVVELKSYKRTPFASIIINSESLPSEIKKISQSENTKEKKKRTVEVIKKIIESSALKLYNMYVDAEYDKYREIFKDNNFHTVILYVEDGSPVNDYDKTILIAGYPVQGMVSPIHKSPDYNLLNGAFISTKMFTMKSVVLDNEPWMATVYTDNDFLYYDKLVYVYVDVKVKFELREYIQISEILGIGYDYLYEVILSERSGFPILRYNCDTRKIPINGREYLFQKPDKNMFHLSDVPKDIVMRKHVLSREL